MAGIQPIIQLRTGYSKLKDYSAKLDISLTPLCDCGQYETVEHVLIQCPNYELELGHLRVHVINLTGNSYFNLSLLLGAGVDDILPEYREEMTQILLLYLDRTGVIKQLTGIPFASTMKVAAAAAIIRSKPKHMTGEEFARQRCNEFSISQLKWRQKFEKMETELIHVKQNLALKEFQDPTSQSCESELPSSCEAICPTPSPYLEEGKSRKNSGYNVAKDHLNLHSKFLQGVTQLRFISRKSQYSDLQETAKQTVLKSLGIVKLALGQRDQHFIPYSSIQHAAQCVASFCSVLSDKDWSELAGSVEDLIGGILEDLVSSKHDEKYEFQEELSGLFLRMTEIPRLKTSALAVLLTRVEHCSNHLRDVSRNEKLNLDPSLFENIYFILTLMEKLLTSCQSTNDLTFKATFYGRFQERLDDSLLHLTDQFPLFSQFVWRIGALFHLISSQS